MGTSVKIGGYQFPSVLTWQITEDSTPLAANDTSGSPGLISLTIKAPDPDLEYVQDTGMKWVLNYGHNILLEKPLTLTDSRWGVLPGKVSSVSRPSPSTIQINATTDLNRLNVFNMTVQPYSGTLSGFLNLIATRVGFTTMPAIEASLASRPVVVPGWRGDLWYHLKLLAQAIEFDLSLVDGVITVRRLRQRTIRTARDISSGGELGVPNLARAVEVYQYQSRAITDELVYPVGGWTPETESLNVNAGEAAKYTLPLSSSVTSIQQPVMQEYVAPQHRSSSVYTIIANDGLPVPPALWSARGGDLTVTINLDTRTLTVRLRGAEKIPLASGDGYATNFSVALASDTTGSRYSTLRIVGTGVTFTKEKRRFRTGVRSSQSDTPVGVTIDNPFLSTKDQVSRAGVRAAVQFAGPVPSLSKNTVEPFRGEKAIGNLSGARVYDKPSARPYRLRTASISPTGVNASFDDDLTFGDVAEFHIGRTYGEVQESRAGITYRDDYLMGLRY